jgi:predicted outer membrane repeat protein
MASVTALDMVSMGSANRGGDQVDAQHFDQLARVLGERRTRRGLAALLAGPVAAQLIAVPGSEAGKKGKRRRRKRKAKRKKTQNRACTPSCAGCGGSDGCGGTCRCGANQFCDGGVCRTCDVTCNGDAVACGAALQQRLLDGGTIYACSGRYQGNFTMGTARLIGTGNGDNPATSTILDAAGEGRVVTINDGATAELIRLRIKGGRTSGNTGAGVRADSGDLRITDCTITENEAANGGGGIHAKGAFQLTNSTVSLNTSSIGGGLRLEGTQPIFITGSVISGNKTSTGNTYGGGIYNVNTATLTIIDTEIRGNEAASGGGGILNYIGTITMNAGSKVINNMAPNGGGISNQAGTINLNGATVSGNSAPQCVNVPGC